MAEAYLIQLLLDHYVYQREELVRKAGGESRLNRGRLESLMRPRLEKMADLIEDWDVQPDVVMTAAFAWAKYNRHAGGPMPNMLHSSKYLANALSHYLQVPYEVVMEKRASSAFLERMNYEFGRFRDELNAAGVTDLVTATSYPIEVRYLMAVLKLDGDAMFYMAQELLEVMGRDRRISMWMEHRGVKYDVVAEKFNRRKKSHKYERT